MNQTTVQRITPIREYVNMHLFSALKCTLFNYMQELRSIERHTEARTYPRLISLPEFT